MQQQDKSHSSTKTIPRLQHTLSVNNNQIHTHQQSNTFLNSLQHDSQPFKSEKKNMSNQSSSSNNKTQSLNNKNSMPKLQVYRFQSPQARKQSQVLDQEEHKFTGDKTNENSHNKNYNFQQKMQIQHDNESAIKNRPIEVNSQLIKLEEIPITNKIRNKQIKITSNQSQKQQLNNSINQSKKNSIKFKLIFQECFKNIQKQNYYDMFESIKTSEIAIQDLDNPILQKVNTVEGLKKTMLKHFCYSGSKSNCQKIKVYFFNLYSFGKTDLQYPILSDENLNTIFYNYSLQSKNLFVRMIRQTELRKYTQRNNKNKIAVEFDSDGELQENEEDWNNMTEEQINIRTSIKVNTPSMGKYTGKNLMRCAFCQKSSKDIDGIKVCGSFYGPFRSKKSNYYVHLLCAIWCSRVYIENDKLKNVPRQIDDSRKDYCQYCCKNGAGLQCHNEKCKVTTHYECALEFCQFNWPEYTFKCHKCRTDERMSQNDQSQSVFSESKKSSKFQCKMQIEYPKPQQQQSNKKQYELQKRMSLSNQKQTKTPNSKTKKQKNSSSKRNKSSQVKQQNIQQNSNSKKLKKK